MSLVGQLIINESGVKDPVFDYKYYDSIVERTDKTIDINEETE